MKYAICAVPAVAGTAIAGFRGYRIAAVVRLDTRRGLSVIRPEHTHMTDEPVCDGDLVSARWLALWASRFKEEPAGLLP